MEAYVGAIFACGFNYVPQNDPGAFLLCDGSLQNITQYEMLYSLLGTTYGGDGVKTFGIPNLLGRVPIGFGQGPGLQNYPLASTGGYLQTQLYGSNMPEHTHQITVSTLPAGGPATTNNPFGNYYGVTTGTNKIYNNAQSKIGGVASTISRISGTSGGWGDGGLITTVPPYQVVTYIICAIGAYPQPS